ncbi:MAG: di-heme oxidoredictase family protein [Planctomycetota bacterium]
MNPKMRNGIICLALIASFTLPLMAQAGEEPNLGATRVTQADITGGGLSFMDIRLAGRRMFTTPFNKLDGYGVAYDKNVADHTSFSNRPTLQNNGTFLRVNGLDSQSCNECHGIVSHASIPAVLGVGGVGGITSSAMFMTRDIDVDDSDLNGFAFFDGRLINPPFIFGAGGIEAIGKEMTTDLQALKMQALLNPNTIVNLVTKAVNFGTISHDGSNFDLSNIQGIEEDLVVRPFGRKGENFTTRDFDRGAMQFHFGMEPVEVVGAGNDGDGDGVTDEILIGEMSALHVFANTQVKPRIVPQTGAGFGFALFSSIGCTECHRPVMTTLTNNHTFSFPDVGDDPSANIYGTISLASAPMSFNNIPGGGIAAFCFADLKRHDMGPDLAESFGASIDNEFTTARLWGVADTAPYLHDGRALTLTDAIMAHGGEAATSKNNFASMQDFEKVAILSMLRSLRTPENPNAELGGPEEDINN